MSKNGFIIDYSVEEFPGMGKGIVVQQSVKQGETLWRHVSGQVRVFNQAELVSHLDQMSVEQARYELEHLYGLAEFPNHVIRIDDDGVLINHDDNPAALVRGHANIQGETPVTQETRSASVKSALVDTRYDIIASRDLEAGEQITLNYNVGVVDPEFYESLCDQYGVTWPWQ